ncbi:two-component system sensor histidine kinase DesK [Streptomyces pseudovenezuelae]|uniref:Two-component system sensor histidine kinase DesK n=1 Tax=Streptomyces pseudovenezuelae TaxID=67350 RepID=A0ABT6LFY6_9ACTN|nr:two-component system sensor histidine kinase DesK [Streptomyces pseudovenezuelae]
MGGTVTGPTGVGSTGIRRTRGWWRRKSTPAKVETYTRWSFHTVGVSEFVAVGLPAVGTLGAGLGAVLLGLVAAHAALCTVTVSRALDWTRGRNPQPVRMLWTLAALSAVTAVAAMLIADRGPDGDGSEATGSAIFGIVLIAGAGVISLGVADRRRVCLIVGGFTVGAGLLSLPLGVPAPGALVTALGVLVGAGFLAFTAVFSVWLLNAVYELDAARETRARLAVAEERLRFGRDMHDVMGRNLAVIALKSELAVQLARRGRPEAVDQMTEVQRIAQETQREVRAVVRGYREADLDVELAGAQGVLSAAGIACEVTGEAGGLPGEVQSALAWVVREATTNVLRHGDARRCEVLLRVKEGRVVLTVENDGAKAADGSTGSGLAGLRERLSAVGGTLVAGPVEGDVFRVVAEVPVNVSEVTA